MARDDVSTQRQGQGWGLMSWDMSLTGEVQLGRRWEFSHGFTLGELSLNQ